MNEIADQYVDFICWGIQGKGEKMSLRQRFILIAGRPYLGLSSNWNMCHTIG